MAVDLPGPGNVELTRDVGVLKYQVVKRPNAMMEDVMVMEEMLREREGLKIQMRDMPGD